MSRKLKQTVGAEITHRDTFTVADFDVSPGSNGKRTEVASYQAERPMALRNGFPVDLALMAFEQFSADGAAPETFNLSNDLIKSGATSENVVVYVNGSKQTPAAVDYDANTVDVDTAAGDDVGIYYAAGEQAQVAIEKEAPNGTKEPLWSGEMSLLHKRDHDREPITFDLSDSYFQSVIPTDWKLKVYVNAPYVTRFEKDIDGDGNPERATNALLGLPYLGGRGRIDGLGKATRLDAAER